LTPLTKILRTFLPPTAVQYAADLRVRSPHTSARWSASCKQTAADSLGSCATPRLGQRDGRIAVSLNGPTAGHTISASTNFYVTNLASTVISAIAYSLTRWQV